MANPTIRSAIFTNQSTGQTVAVPFGTLAPRTSAGDLAIAVIVVGTNVLPTAVPSGYSLVIDVWEATSSKRLLVYMKPNAIANEPDASFTFAGNVLADKLAIAVAGASTVAPLNAHAEASFPAATLNWLVNSISPTNPEALLLYFAAFGDASATSPAITPPAGMTEHTEYHPFASRGAYLAYQLLSSAGPTGTKTAVFATGQNRGIATLIAIASPNQPPNQPVWVAPAANATVDLSGTYGLQWTFTDPDAGNTQSGVYIRASIDGSNNKWWSGAAWVDVETKIVQAGQTYTLPTAAIDNNHYYDLAVATEDNNNAKSSYSPVVRLQGLPPVPTNVVPSVGATVNSDVPTLSLTRAASPLTTKGRWQLATDAGFTTNVRLITEPDADFSVSGVASQVVTTGSQLFQGTWYIRAAVVDQNAIASAWTAAQTFVVSHAPGTANWVPTAGQALGWGGTGDITLDWDFTDTSPVDSQTAYQVVLERNDTGAVILDTGKVPSPASQHTLNLAAGNKDITLRWKVRVWDSDDVVGPYSAYNLFIVQDAPQVTIGYPANGGTADNPAPTITWSVVYSVGRAQREFRVVVTRQSDNVVIHDSNWIVSTATSYTLPSAMLVLGVNYTVLVQIRDTNYLTGQDLNSFTATWAPPAGPPKAITDLYETQGHVKVTWQDTLHDPAFLYYRVYRREVGAQNRTLMATYSVVQANYEYRDYVAESGTQYEYDVVQVVDRFGTVIESNPAPVILTPVSSDYWIIYSNEPGDWAYNLRLHHATADSPVEEYETSEIALIGRGRKVDFGDRLGWKGTLTVELWDVPGETARMQLLQLRALKAERRAVWLRNPFGDIWQVVFDDTPFSRMAGVGTREFGTLTMPYIEVAD